MESSSGDDEDAEAPSGRDSDNDSQPALMARDAEVMYEPNASRGSSPNKNRFSMADVEQADLDLDAQIEAAIRAQDAAVEEAQAKLAATDDMSPEDMDAAIKAAMASI